MILAGRVEVDGRRAEKAGAAVGDDAVVRVAGRRASLRVARRREARGGARDVLDRPARPRLRGRRRFDRRLHRLPAPARRPARVRDRRRVRAARRETARRSARRGVGEGQRARALGRASSRAGRARSGGPLVHLRPASAAPPSSRGSRRRRAWSCSSSRSSKRGGRTSRAAGSSGRRRCSERVVSEIEQFGSGLGLLCEGVIPSPIKGASRQPGVPVGVPPRAGVWVKKQVSGIRCQVSGTRARRPT